MDDIFTQCREGNAVAVRLWLDNTENDLNQGWDIFYRFLCVFLSAGWFQDPKSLLSYALFHM